MDYNKYHAEIANSYLDVALKEVLVVGCNRGKDVRYFIDFGAQTVCGVDVIDDIGSEYAHENVEYHKISVEGLSFQDNLFDLVYCFATMEHVPNIQRGFSEMVRVTKPGGVIYCVASPLWNSRQGHHYSHVFDIQKYPWLHLRMNKEEIKQGCHNGTIEYPRHMTNINSNIDYMMDAKNFNFSFAKEYIDICNQFLNVDIIRNDLDSEPEECLDYLSEDKLDKLMQKGLDSTELLALTHTFIATKKD
ncbi:class I SAM-dependent methyltransferase [Leptothoe kymatousa]|uniref:Class I SAM-dependent methyltransferase n=1 Tax=Leptothoe kymatousa TAU-MAC 1615 TaxID=2364775 RepID=A0ABS5Y596_9CYAN|nr:class I SAM-dependent methyltransferase [Leptothoe kymatousa]MBT9313002.1 class I SAM-dependent methyltransferase [Leptothoe kymatousa TAU-MAC 1615]